MFITRLVCDIALRSHIPLIPLIFLVSEFSSSRVSFSLLLDVVIFEMKTLLLLFFFFLLTFIFYWGIAIKGLPW